MNEIKSALLLAGLLCLAVPGVISVGTICAGMTVSAAVDVLYDGTVILTPGETFTVVPYNADHLADSYTVSYTTPLGALHKASLSAGFTYDVTDKDYAAGKTQVLLLDNVGTYLRNSPGKWYAYVNGVYKDGHDNHDDGLDVMEVANGDHVDYFYAAGVSDATDMTGVQTLATAAVTTIVQTGSEPAGWTLSLSGARDQVVTKSYFQEGLACSGSGHNVSWTDVNGSEWSGVPLWLLVGMVDDDPDTGPDHFNFNDDLAAAGYSVKVISDDGWSTTLASADIARNNGYIIADKLNGTDLPLLTPGGKRSWPLHLQGASVFSGQTVGNVTSIELVGLPEPDQGWNLTMEGDVIDVIPQSLFEEAIACRHNVTYTDDIGRVWTGVPLWDLAGTVD
ncbi:MAG: hypothetical protein LUQ25_07980, partial [Methanoregulaceae archaeon]|nr:hypothetical protein [Methanoregulaceae archaeon]